MSAPVALAGEPMLDQKEGPVLIDCDSCTVRGAACGDCVVTVLLGAPPDGVELDDAERTAIAALAEHGLVPPLRLTTPSLPRRAAVS